MDEEFSKPLEKLSVEDYLAEIMELLKKDESTSSSKLKSSLRSLIGEISLLGSSGGEAVLQTEEERKFILESLLPQLVGILQKCWENRCSKVLDELIEALSISFSVIPEALFRANQSSIYDILSLVISTFLRFKLLFTALEKNRKRVDDIDFFFAKYDVQWQENLLLASYRILTIELMELNDVQRVIALKRILTSSSEEYTAQFLVLCNAIAINGLKDILSGEKVKKEGGKEMRFVSRTHLTEVLEFVQIISKSRGYRPEMAEAVLGSLLPVIAEVLAFSSISEICGFLGQLNDILGTISYKLDAKIFKSLFSAEFGELLAADSEELRYQFSDLCRNVIVVAPASLLDWLIDFTEAHLDQAGEFVDFFSGILTRYLKVHSRNDEEAIQENQENLEECASSRAGDTEDALEELVDIISEPLGGKKFSFSISADALNATATAETDTATAIEKAIFDTLIRSELRSIGKTVLETSLDGVCGPVLPEGDVQRKLLSPSLRPISSRQERVTTSRKEVVDLHCLLIPNRTGSILESTSGKNVKDPAFFCPLPCRISRNEFLVGVEQSYKFIALMTNWLKRYKVFGREFEISIVRFMQLVFQLSTASLEPLKSVDTIANLLRTMLNLNCGVARIASLFAISNTTILRQFFLATASNEQRNDSLVYCDLIGIVKDVSVMTHSSSLPVRFGSLNALSSILSMLPGGLPRSISMGIVTAVEAEAARIQKIVTGAAETGWIEKRGESYLEGTRPIEVAAIRLLSELYRNIENRDHFLHNSGSSEPVAEFELYKRHKGVEISTEVESSKKPEQLSDVQFNYIFNLMLGDPIEGKGGRAKENDDTFSFGTFVIACRRVRTIVKADTSMNMDSKSSTRAFSGRKMESSVEWVLRKMALCCVGNRFKTDRGNASDFFIALENSLKDSLKDGINGEGRPSQLSEGELSRYQVLLDFIHLVELYGLHATGGSYFMRSIRIPRPAVVFLSKNKGVIIQWFSRLRLHAVRVAAACASHWHTLRHAIPALQLFVNAVGSNCKCAGDVYNSLGLDSLSLEASIIKIHTQVNEYQMRRKERKESGVTASDDSRKTTNGSGSRTTSRGKAQQSYQSKSSSSESTGSSHPRQSMQALSLAVEVTIHSLVAYLRLGDVASVRGLEKLFSYSCFYSSVSGHSAEDEVLNYIKYLRVIYPFLFFISAVRNHVEGKTERAIDKYGKLLELFSQDERSVLSNAGLSVGEGKVGKEEKFESEISTEDVRGANESARNVPWSSLLVRTTASHYLDALAFNADFNGLFQELTEDGVVSRAEQCVAELSVYDISDIEFLRNCFSNGGQYSSQRSAGGQQLPMLEQSLALKPGRLVDHEGSCFYIRALRVIFDVISGFESSDIAEFSAKYSRLTRSLCSFEQTEFSKQMLHGPPILREQTTGTISNRVYGSLLNVHVLLSSGKKQSLGLSSRSQVVEPLVVNTLVQHSSLGALSHIGKKKDRRELTQVGTPTTEYSSSLLLKTATEALDKENFSSYERMREWYPHVFETSEGELLRLKHLFTQGDYSRSQYIYGLLALLSATAGSAATKTNREAASVFQAIAEVYDDEDSEDNSDKIVKGTILRTVIRLAYRSSSEEAGQALFAYALWAEEEGHIETGIKSYFSSLRLSYSRESVNSVVLRLIHLLEDERNTEMIQKLFARCLSNTPLTHWIRVAPQLVARLEHPNPAVVAAMRIILVRIASTAPRALVYSVIGDDILALSSNDNLFLDSENQSGSTTNTPKEEVIAALFKTDPGLVKEVTLFLRELERLANLWEEQWVSALSIILKSTMPRLQALHREIRRISASSDITDAEKRRFIKERYNVMMLPTVTTMEQVIQKTCGKKSDIEIKEAESPSSTSSGMNASTNSWSSSMDITPHERSFIFRYSEVLKDIVKELSDPSDAFHPERPWNALREIHRSLMARIKGEDASAQSTMRGQGSLNTKPASFSTTIHLTETNPRLCDWKCKRVPIPIPELHKADAGDEIPVIVRISPIVPVLHTKTRPRIINLLASNGKSYKFLLKGREDMHLDERIMQFLETVNHLLASNLLRSKQRRPLQSLIRTYSVVPFGYRNGLVQWIEGTTLYSLYKQWRQNQSALSISEGGIQKENIKKPVEDYHEKLVAHLLHKGELKDTSAQKVHQRLAASRSKWPLDLQRKVFDELESETSQDILSRELLIASPSAGEWVARGAKFAGTTAAMGIVGMLIGLGDRHLDNILVNLRTGESAHVDFGICFWKGLKLRVPELVPFRLTRNILYALGPMGTEGRFRAAAVSVLRVLRERAAMDEILALLRTFAYDPLVDWTVEIEADEARRELELAVALELFVSRVEEVEGDLEHIFEEITEAIEPCKRIYDMDSLHATALTLIGRIAHLKSELSGMNKEATLEHTEAERLKKSIYEVTASLVSSTSKLHAAGDRVVILKGKVDGIVLHSENLVKKILYSNSDRGDAVNYYRLALMECGGHEGREFLKTSMPVVISNILKVVMGEIIGTTENRGLAREVVLLLSEERKEQEEYELLKIVSDIEKLISDDMATLGFLENSLSDMDNEAIVRANLASRMDEKRFVEKQLLSLSIDYWDVFCMSLQLQAFTLLDRVTEIEETDGVSIRVVFDEVIERSIALVDDVSSIIYLKGSGMEIMNGGNGKNAPPKEDFLRRFNELLSTIQLVDFALANEIATDVSLAIKNASDQLSLIEEFRNIQRELSKYKDSMEHANMNFTFKEFLSVVIDRGWDSRFILMRLLKEITKIYREHEMLNNTLSVDDLDTPFVDPQLDNLFIDLVNDMVSHCSDRLMSTRTEEFNHDVFLVGNHHVAQPSHIQARNHSQETRILVDSIYNTFKTRMIQYTCNFLSSIFQKYLILVITWLGPSRGDDPVEEGPIDIEKLSATLVNASQESPCSDMISIFGTNLEVYLEKVGELRAIELELVGMRRRCLGIRSSLVDAAHELRYLSWCSGAIIPDSINEHVIKLLEGKNASHSRTLAPDRESFRKLVHRTLSNTEGANLNAISGQEVASEIEKFEDLRAGGKEAEKLRRDAYYSISEYLDAKDAHFSLLEEKKDLETRLSDSHSQLPTLSVKIRTCESELLMASSELSSCQENLMRRKNIFEDAISGMEKIGKVHFSFIGLSTSSRVAGRTSRGAQREHGISLSGPRSPTGDGDGDQSETLLSEVYRLVENIHNGTGGLTSLSDIHSRAKLFLSMNRSINEKILSVNEFLKKLMGMIYKPNDIGKGNANSNIQTPPEVDRSNRRESKVELQQMIQELESSLDRFQTLLQALYQRAFLEIGGDTEDVYIEEEVEDDEDADDPDDEDIQEIAEQSASATSHSRFIALINKQLQIGERQVSRGGHASGLGQNSGGNEQALSALRSVRSRLNGKLSDDENAEIFDVESQVAEATRQAKDKALLCRMYEGWCPWF